MHPAHPPPAYGPAISIVIIIIINGFLCLRKTLQENSQIHKATAALQASLPTVHVVYFVQI